MQDNHGYANLLMFIQDNSTYKD